MDAVNADMNLKRAGGVWPVGLLIFLIGISNSIPATPPGRDSTSLLKLLESKGVPADAIRGLDFQGIPIVCGTQSGSFQSLNANKPPWETNPPPTTLPAGMRSWECVPGVIRNNGTDFFRLEVDVNGPVNQVTFQVGSSLLRYVSGAALQNLRDDGLDGDRVAGDRIFTSDGIRYSGAPFPNNLWYNSASPAGLHLQQIGTLSIIETNGTATDFLITPGIAMMSTNVPLVEISQMASNIFISPHLVNVVTSARKTQQSLRVAFNPLNGLTIPIYSVLPDAFDFFVFFSMDHAEYFPFESFSGNFVSGAHLTVQVKYSGTGLFTNNSDYLYFGSAGRLQGVNVIDTTTRGVYDGICTHELIHQWASKTSGSLGLNHDGSHYPSTCSANSLVGGTHWTLNTNGIFVKNCDDSTQAPPLDKYMMGLISGSSVPPLYVATNAPGCYAIVTNGYRTVTIAEIQAVHGVRTPTPANAQKDFSFCFVAESFGRPLTAVEMTFYDVLAGHYTKTIPVGEPSPVIPSGWASIDRYFGEGSKWSSDVADLIRPKIILTELLSNGTARISGNGYVGRSYRLLKSTNLMSWSAVTNKTADTNGSFVLQDSSVTHVSRFYRVSTP
jgi:hypothetical protein